MITDREYLLLSELAYNNFKKDGKDPDIDKNLGMLLPQLKQGIIAIRAEKDQTWATQLTDMVEECSYFKLIDYENTNGKFGKGFCAAVFEKTTLNEDGTETTEIVFAMRGTEPNVNALTEDGLADALIGIADQPVGQFEQARDFVIASLKKIAEDKNILLADNSLTGMVNQMNVNFTGHSLGGALAQYLGYLSKDAYDDVLGKYRILNANQGASRIKEFN